MPTTPQTRLDEGAARLLAEVVRTPWSAAPHLADQVGGPHGEMQARVELLMRDGLLQSITLPDGEPLYALTQRGVQGLAERIGISPGAVLKRANCDEKRFWLMRGAAEIVQEVNVFGARLRRVLRPSGQSVQWETLILRRFKGNDTALHGRFAFPEAGRSIILMIDPGLIPIWHWWRHLRYCQLARQSQVLLITTTKARAVQWLIFARQIAPKLQLTVTADRAEVLAGDLLDAEWLAIQAGESSRNEGLHVVPQQPFAWPDIATTVKITKPIDAVLRTPSARELKHVDAFDLEALPQDLDGLPMFEQLDDIDCHVLDFVAQHSVAPASCISRFVGALPTKTAPILEQLRSQGLCEVYQPRRHKEQPSLWSASEQALRLWLLSQAHVPAEGLLLRHAGARAMHERHASHTCAVFDFFERLHQDAERRSRAGRWVDAVDGQVNDGHIPHFEVEVFEDDVTCAASFIYGGVRYRWMPDAYGVLRAGLSRVRFWLEIDGSPGGAAHLDPERWERKLSGLCAYAVSRNWVLRYRSFPILLIVTTDLRALGLIQDVLTQAAAGYGVPLPAVFVASAAAIAQRGPLADVWQAVHKRGTTFVNVFAIDQRIKSG